MTSEEEVEKSHVTEPLKVEFLYGDVHVIDNHWH